MPRCFGWSVGVLLCAEWVGDDAGRQVGDDAGRQVGADVGRHQDVLQDKCRLYIAELQCKNILDQRCSMDVDEPIAAKGARPWQQRRMLCCLVHTFSWDREAVQEDLNHPFRAKCECIITKDDGQYAKLWQVDKNDPEHGLPMLKCLERAYQKFRMTFVLRSVEAKSIIVQIRLCKNLQPRSVYRNHNVGEEKRPLKVLQGQRWIRLNFNHLHKREVTISPPPSMRSLLAKALGAYEKFRDEYPDPRAHLDLYKRGCQIFDAKLQNSFLSLQVGREEEA